MWNVMCMFLVRFTERLTELDLFWSFVSLVSFGLSVTDVLCPAIWFLSLYVSSHSVVPFSLSDLSLLRVCVCVVCLRALLCKALALSDESVCYLFGSGGREWRWDVLYRHDCKDDLWRSQMYNKKCQKKLKLCVYYWLDNFLFSQVNTSWAVGKLVWLCFVCSLLSIAVGVNFY